MAKRNKLIDKTGPIPAKLDRSVVERVEKDIAAYNAEAEGALGEQIAELQALSTDARDLMADAEKRNNLYGFVHRLWGDAPSQGHPMLGRVAESLCLLLANEEDHGAKEAAILEHHIAALSSLWLNRNQEERVAEALVQSLEESTRQYKS